MFIFPKKFENEFVEKVLPLECVARGILASEGFAFCAFCKLYNIDMIIESGVYNGQSTLIWSKFFRDISIIAIDAELKTSTLEKFELNENVIFYNGNARNYLPRRIKENPEKRIAVFIDGPKGLTAIKLAKKCFAFDNVFMVGVHDTHKLSFNKLNETRLVADNLKETKFHTDDVDFVKQYKYMDVVPNSVGTGDEDICWRPYGLLNKIDLSERCLGSYGPTISFLLKDIK